MILLNFFDIIIWLREQMNLSTGNMCIKEEKIFFYTQMNDNFKL